MHIILQLGSYNSKAKAEYYLGRLYYFYGMSLALLLRLMNMVIYPITCVIVVWDGATRGDNLLVDLVSLLVETLLPLLVFPSGASSSQLSGIGGVISCLFLPMDSWDVEDKQLTLLKDELMLTLDFHISRHGVLENKIMTFVNK